MSNQSELRKELCRLYHKFVSYYVEANPNYVDSDFNFDNFINYLELEESDEIRKQL